MKHQQNSGPLFVVGIWRSGTSLLYTLLNQNPQISLLYEGDLPLLRPLFRNGKAKSDWIERWDFWNGAPQRHNIDVTALPANVTDIRTATEAIYKKYAGLAIWGCKSPNYYDYLTTLADEFPNARFIVIWRDLRDIVRSILEAGKNSPWFRRPAMPLRAILGYRELKSQCEQLVARGIPLHQLQYEEMVEDPAKAMMGVSRFLGIAFDPRMASLEGADRSAIYAAEHHAGVRDTKIGARKKKEQMPARLRRKVERYVALWRSEYGGNWPAVPAMDGPNAAKPSWLERAVDRIGYGFWRGFDGAVLHIYCSVPLRLLRAYRVVKRYNDGVAVRPVQKPVTHAGAD
jgi:Sulfotransferase family